MIKAINFVRKSGERTIITNVKDISVSRSNKVFTYNKEDISTIFIDIYQANSLEEANEIVDHIGYIAHENDGYVELDMILEQIKDNKILEEK